MLTLRHTLSLTSAHLSALFVLLVLAQELGLLPGSLGLPVLSFALPLLVIPALSLRGDDGAASLRPAPLLLLLAFAVALALRLGPSLRNDVLLGYDPGLYKYLLDLYLQALPHIPDASLPAWVRTNYPQGLPVLGDVIYVVPGLDPEQMMRYAFPAISAAVVFPVYLLGRELFGPRAAIIGATLYAVSYTQFSVFTLMYIKNAVALFLLPLALYALQRRGYPLFGILLAGIAIFHRPTLLVAALAVLVYLVVTRQRGVLAGVLLAMALVTPFYLARLAPTWELVRGTADATLSNLGQQVATGGGTFLSVERYRWVSLAYQPFGAIGAIALISRRRWDTPLLLLVAAAAMVALQIAFFRRHLVPLDLAMLLLAGLGVKVVFLRATRRTAALGTAAVLVIVIATALPTLRGYQDSSPLMTVPQMAAVQWLTTHTPPDAAVVTTSHDAPWVLGWSGRRVIAPGLFQWNRHGQQEWEQFLATADPEQATAFLNRYDGPLYVYYAETPFLLLAEEKFQPPFFDKLYDEGGARVYAYSPQNLTTEVTGLWTP